MNKNVEEVQRRCGSLLVCPGCNLTVADQEKYVIIGENGFKYHTVQCKDKAIALAEQRKQRNKEITQSNPIPASA